MNYLKEETLRNIRGQGYKVYNNGYVIKISNRSSFKPVIAIMMILSGIFLAYFTFGNYKIMLLSIMLILIGFLNLKRNRLHEIVFNTRNSLISYSTGYSARVIVKDFSAIEEVRLYYYDQSSYTSAFEGGNKDYFADINIQWMEGGEVELFHFKSRTKEGLEFTKNLVIELNDFLKGKNTE
ncbi:MAG: hypothetical protein OEY34_00730 [Cyclobacteriaceae bacterium]|nr:hypothetical protein [Cyclobacteriaceae bacterium]